MIKTNQELLSYLNKLFTSSVHQGQIRETTFRKGELLVMQDEPAGDLFILRSGVVKCFITEENGRDYLLEFLGEGEIIGELELLMNKDNLGSVQALTVVEAFRIDKKSFAAFLSEDRILTQYLLQELATRLSRTARRAAYQQIFPLQYALLKVLYLFSENKQAISKQDLADYLAISIRSLNRLLKQMGDQEPDFANSGGLFAIPKEKLLSLMQKYY
ncbi:Crp/Fnr family transcriptional regulator [Rhodocytophaga rosea]|uniref:Crp/Fnr family transcriptional regulator n=1 Tax=Rhodocytophaga rosea TaxID=2704465 RepID=A0A6C0GT44_9BACT|nr:Crp/Fnr family transcriptional regulator [Rhodocytophaga rosea]QHT71338.1 Crp/Fnr family transcriptional regulator [Rhodocytophaga rosea]